MTRRDRLPDSDLAELGNAYGPLAPQRQWDASAPDDFGPWWSDPVLAIIVLALGAGAGAVLYVLGWSWS